MFAFLPLVALLSAFGLSTKYTIPAPRIDTTRGLPDFEAQRAAELDDAMAGATDSLHYVADSLRAIAGATVAADPMPNIPLDAFAVAHCPEFVARAAALDSLAGGSGIGWKSTCPTVRPLSVLPSPALVQVAARGNIMEPARATTCYLGLDCLE